MTQKEISLLLQNLNEQLSHGVKVVYLATTYNVQYVDIKSAEVKLDGMPYTVSIGQVKPYLRPMSSMTEEELKELWESCTVSLKTDLRTIVQVGMMWKIYMMVDKL